MNLSIQKIKNNLVFPQNNEIPAEITNNLGAIGINLANSFTDEEKNEILNYIDALYVSETAKEQFNKITNKISIIPIQQNEFRGGIIPLSQGDYPVVFLSKNILNEEYKIGHLSQTGTFVKYDPKLVFMHEIIHAITGLPDTIPTPEHPNLPRIFSSPEASLGQTQVIANEVHKEVDPNNPNAPRRVSYQDVWRLHEFDSEATEVGIKEGTEFTKGKIAGVENSEIQIGAFITDTVFETYSKLGSFGEARIIDTSLNSQQTNDLFILIEERTGPNTIPVRINAGSGNDYLYGDVNNDTLFGGKDNDYLYGGAGNDELRGNAFVAGTDIDTVEYSDVFENYNIETDENNKRLTKITHEEMSDGVEIDDGTDDLYDIEWGIFKGEDLQPLAAIPSSSEDGEMQAMVASATVSAPRVIPLPLTDGVETTETVEVDGVEQPPYYDPTLKSPHVSLTAPVAMLDGDVDFTLNISPFEQNSEYNVVYIFDRSSSTNSSAALQTTKDAYTNLTNYFINTGIAENINFSLVSFSRYATIQENLSADEIITAIENTTSETQNVGTAYRDALTKADQFFADSALNRDNTTNLAYFVSDGRSYPNGFNYDDPIPSYHTKATDLQEFAYVQAFGLDIPLNDGRANDNPAVASQINYVDSNGGVIVTEASELTTEISQSGLAGDVQEINILVDGEIVDTIQPSQLTDSPFGLTYEGSVDELDVSIDAENVVTAEVVFNNGLPTTSIEHTVTAGEGAAVDGDGNDIAQSDDSNQDPFERMLDGGDSDDEITLGYADLGANGGAGGDKIIGNERDNVIDGGAGNDTLTAYGGDDRITTGGGTDKVNGGEGIDTAVYNDVTYGNGSAVSLRKVANSVSYNNTDTLTDVEFIQFSDVRVSADTLEVTPVVEVGELSITEGNSANTIAELELNLSTPAPVAATFDYATEDLDAIAGSDYVATSGQVTIPAGQTTASLNLEIIGDEEYEQFEQFALNFSNLSGATFANNRTDDAVGVTIENDDVLPLNLIGDDEDNYLRGEDGNDTIDGAGGNDTIVGNAGNDNLTGGSGNDTIVEAANTDFTLTDTALVGNGNDTISQIEFVELTGGTGNNAFIARDTTQISVTLDGAGGNDNLVGGAKNDSLFGRDGNDQLAGRNGNDQLDGADGSDTLYGSLGNDSLNGGNDNDLIYGTDGSDTMTGGAGNDIINGGVGFDQLHETADVNFQLTDTQLTGRGTDTLSNLEAARLIGGAGDNVLNAGLVNNLNVTLAGGLGNDSLYSGAKADRLYGAQGADRLESRKGNDLLYGNLGDDRLFAGDGNDTLYGGGDNDILQGGNGNDTINGGTGHDTLSETGNVDFTLTDTTLVGNGSDTITQVEFAQLTGGAGNNLLTARDVTQMNVTLNGAAGNDNLIAGAKDDSLIGGAGNDTLGGRDGSDHLIAGEGNDTLYGSNGDDSLDGGTGSDRLFGSNGDDLLTGGSGDDTINGGAGNDTLSETGNVNFTLTDTTLVGNGSDTITQVEFAELTGGGGNNLLSARDVTQMNVTLNGAGGNDNLVGGAKDDSLIGGASNDTLGGRDGSDRLVAGEGNDTLYGSNGNDSLDGGNNSDRLFGSNGDDLLTGGSGDDTINGGQGADTIVLDLVSGTDTIQGFNRSVDLIGLPATIGFSDLSVTDNNAGTATLIRDTTNNERLLAIVDNVMANQITADNFTNI